MKKEYRKMERNAKGKIREIQGGRVTVEIPLPIADVLIGVTESVEELAREVGLMVISATMESEAEQIAGKKNIKNPARRANWWGEQIGHVYYEGQKVLIEHPRIRSKENTEIPLKTYNAFQGPKAILVRDIILGISSRNYEESIEKLLNGYGVKKSSVSRHFVKATSEQMRVFLERSLLGLQLCVILIDGIEFKGDLLVVVLGTGRKRL